MELFIEEIATTPNSTASQLFVNGKPFTFILEDGHRDIKVSGETRIAEGRYLVKPRYHGAIFESYKQKFGHRCTFEITGIPKFSDVLIHIGNTIKDTRGCPLTNDFIGMEGSDFKGMYSQRAYLRLYKVLIAAVDRNEEIWCEVSRRPIIDESIAG